MYLARTLLPQFSNREDFLLTSALFDDDTGQPIKIDGCTTANGQAFTASAWTVTDGVIVTTSANTITIPPFPIRNHVPPLPPPSATALAGGTQRDARGVRGAVGGATWGDTSIEAPSGSHPRHAGARSPAAGHRARRPRPQHQHRGTDAPARGPTRPTTHGRSVPPT